MGNLYPVKPVQRVLGFGCRAFLGIAIAVFVGVARDVPSTHRLVRSEHMSTYRSIHQQVHALIHMIPLNSKC